MKIVAYNGQHRITLPKTLVEEKCWRPGTVLRFIEDEQGRVYLKASQPLLPAEKPPVRGRGVRQGGGR